MSANEVPFLSGMERQDDGPVKLVWSVDALVERARLARESLREEADKLLNGLRAAAATAAGIKNERGPKDFEDRDRELKDLLFEAVKFGSQQGAKGNGHGSVNGNNKIIAVLFTINLALMGAFSSWVVTTVTKLIDGQSEQGKDIAIIKCRIDPACRVVVSSDSKP